MYHVELRQFPNNFCRFNLTEAELGQIVQPWLRGEWIELGERKWNPHQAQLTVLEGPEIPLSQLTMGRGWRNAQRHGRNVTEQLLSAVPAPPSPQPEDRQGGVDSLALTLLAKLGNQTAPLHMAWDIASACDPEGAPGCTLDAAERAVGSLLRAGLIELLTATTEEGELSRPEDQAEMQRLLSSPGSWQPPVAQRPVVSIRRR